MRNNLTGGTIQLRKTAGVESSKHTYKQKGGESGRVKGPN